ALELPMNPRASISTTVFAVDTHNCGLEFLVSPRTLAAFAYEPRIKTARRNLVAFTQERDRILIALLRYELELRRRRSRLKRMAFFKRSFSTRSASYCRSRFRIRT